MLLETISCPVCGSYSHRVIFKSKDFRFKMNNDIFFNVVSCNNCSLFFLNPRPKKSHIAEVYPLRFYEKDKSFLFKLIEPCFRISQQLTIRLLKKHRKNGKTLDIGCGSGDFVLAMQKNGYDAWGVEPNLYAKEFAINCIEGRILCKDIKECNFSPKSFDIITMFQSLEHIDEIKSLFGEIKRVLKDDGLLYICVPNMDFFEFKLLGPYSYNLEVPRHLYFFRRKSIKEFLLKNGFKVNSFLGESIFEYISTPASLHHGLWNFLGEEDILKNNIIKSLTFIPLVLMKFILRVIFFFQNQNIKVLCYKYENS